MTVHHKLNAKRILYKLRKGSKGIFSLSDLGMSTQGRGKNGELADLKTLSRLIQKGLVVKTKTKKYYLTDDGKKVADEVIKEVDAYINFFR